MKKITQALAIMPLILGLAAPADWVLAESESLFPDPVSNLTAAKKKKKKKKKHNYRSLTESDVTGGDQNNSDASGYYASVLSTQTVYFRKIPVPGLSVSNPFPIRVQRYVTPATGFEEEHYTGGGYLISNGNVWVNYGYQLSSGTGSTNFTGATNHRIFNYNGGTRKKTTKRQAFKSYDFSVSGDSDADVVATISNSGYSAWTQYFRKISIPGLKVSNLGDYRIYVKNAYYQVGINEDYWVPISSNYFITDDYLYVAYAYDIYGSHAIMYSPYNPAGDYRFFLYSDGKIKKKKLTKQYVKKYTFNVPGGQSTADKIVTLENAPSTSYYYYKKVAIPGLKMNDQFNIRVLKKVNFTSGFTGEAWAPGSFYVTDGYLWINYGLRAVSGSVDTYGDIGNGDYQVYVYK